MKVLREVKTCLSAASDWGMRRKHRCTWNTFFIRGLWPRSELSCVCRWRRRTVSRHSSCGRGGGRRSVGLVAYLESHDEDAERVQHGQADLRRHVGLQQALAAHVRLRVGVHCGGSSRQKGQRSRTRSMWYKSRFFFSPLTRGRGLVDRNAE